MNIKSAALIFLLLLLLFFPGVLLKGKVYIAPMSDLHLVNYAWADYFHQMASQGVLPLWNPHNSGGAPFGASYLSHVNLVHLMAFVFNDVNLAWNISTVGCVFLGAVLTYAYCVKLKIDKFGAFIAGVIFAFSPSSGLAVDSWGFFIPLVLWLSELYYDEKKIRYLTFIFISLILFITTALPQYSLYAGILFAAYTLFRFRSGLGILLLFFAAGAASFYTFRLIELLLNSGRGHLWFVNVLLPVH